MRRQQATQVAMQQANRVQVAGDGRAATRTTAVIIVVLILVVIKGCLQSRSDGCGDISVLQSPPATGVRSDASTFRIIASKKALKLTSIT